MADYEDDILTLWRKKTKNGDPFLSGKLRIGGKEEDVVVWIGSKDEPSKPYIKIQRQKPRDQSGTPPDEITDIEPF